MIMLMNEEKIKSRPHNSIIKENKITKEIAGTVRTQVSLVRKRKI